MSSNLQQAIAAIKGGDKKTGRQLLTELIKADPNNEQAWLWLAAAVDSPGERRHCLQNVLKINPNNKSAQQGLAALAQKPAPAKPMAGPPAPAEEIDADAHGEPESAEASDRPRKLNRVKTGVQPVEPPSTELPEQAIEQAAAENIMPPPLSPKPTDTQRTKPEPLSLPLSTEAAGVSSVKKCPFCAETIKAEAKVCRYCGNHLEPTKPVALPAEKGISDSELLNNEIARRTAQGWQVVTQTATSVQFRKPKRWSTVLLVLGAVLLICYGAGLIFFLLALVDYAIKKEQVLFVTVDSLRGAHTQASISKISTAAKTPSTWNGPLILAGVLIGGFVLCMGFVLLPAMLVGSSSSNAQTTTQKSKLELPTAAPAEPTPFPPGSIPVTRQHIMDQFPDFNWKVDDFKDGTHRAIGEAPDRTMKIHLFSDQDIEDLTDAEFFFHFPHDAYYLDKLEDDENFSNGYRTMLHFQSVIFPDWNSDQWAREKLRNFPAPLASTEIDEMTERQGVEVWISAGDLSETEYSVAFSVVE